MRLKTTTKAKTKEIKNGDTKILETETTIFVEPVKVKTRYCVKEVLL